MTLKLENDWVWDSWYAHDGNRWHGYFLKAPKSLGDPDLRHFNATQGHAVSDDLVRWDYLGTCFAPAEGPAWDDYTTWTGSVVQDDDGLWHLFYTGTSRAEKGMYQRIGHATSPDMHSWERVGDGLCLDMSGPHTDKYESEHVKGFWHDRAMRDPWVMRDPDGDGWLMFFTARVPGQAEANEGGCVGFATSPDLVTWSLQPPVYAGRLGQLEVPQVFRQGDKWYCLFCTADEHFSEALAKDYPGEPVTGSHYLTGDSPRGPWQLAKGPFLDASQPCQRYAARMLQTDSGLMIIGARYVLPDGQFGGFLTDPDPVVQLNDGTLRIAKSSMAAE